MNEVLRKAITKGKTNNLKNGIFENSTFEIFARPVKYCSMTEGGKPYNNTFTLFLLTVSV